MGAAIAGLAPGAFESFIHAATSLSLVRRVPTTSRPDGAWSMHPLVAEFLRPEVARTEVDTRIEQWVIAHGDRSDCDRAVRWAALSRESVAVHAWLASVDDATLARILPPCWIYAASQGPMGPWLDAARRVCRGAAPTAGACVLAWAQLAKRVGAQDEVLQAAERLQRAGDGERDVAMAAGLRADILQARGELDDALRIRRQDALPVYERLGDVRSKAMTMGKIADILQARGELDEALQIRRQDELPAYERLGEVREQAVFERLGDVREKAVTMGKIADILQARGELDEALRIRRQDQLPVFERLGDVRSKVVTMGKIADILQARGELDEALRIRRQDVLPVLERLGGRDLVVGLVNLGVLLIQHGLPADQGEARGHLERWHASTCRRPSAGEAGRLRPARGTLVKDDNPTSALIRYVGLQVGRRDRRAQRTGRTRCPGVTTHRGRHRDGSSSNAALRR